MNQDEGLEILFMFWYLEITYLSNPQFRGYENGSTHTISRSREGFLYLLMLLPMIPVLNGQTLLNSSSTIQAGLPAPSIGWLDQVLTSDGGHYVVGNTYDSATASQNVWVKLQDVDGGITWELSLDLGNDSDDYGLGVVVSESDLAYVLAVSYPSGDTAGDIYLIALDEVGEVNWTVTYDGGGDDLPTDIGIDFSEEQIYLIAASVDISSYDYDFLTLAYDFAGELVWEERYDDGGRQDYPALLSVSNSGELIIAGGTGDATDNWDYLTVGYFSDGTLDRDLRITSTGFDFAQPKAMIRDVLGSVIITGIGAGAESEEMMTIKLNDTLGIEWTSSLGTTSYDDAALSITADASGALYIAGYEGTSGSKEWTVKKLNQDTGEEIWSKAIPAPAGGASMAKQISVDPNNNIIVSGERYGNHFDPEILVMGISPNGDFLWQEAYKHSISYSGHPLRMSISPLGRISLTGIILDQGLDRYVNLEVAPWERNLDWVADSAGRPIYVGNELIVKFREDALRPGIVNNTADAWNREYGDLATFLTEAQATVVAEALDGACGTGSETSGACPVTMIRIFDQLQTTDTMAIARNGDEIPVPSFWSSFVLSFPEGVNLPAIDSILSDLYPPILYADLNFAIFPTSVPDDPQYIEQYSFYTSTGGINAEQAWEIESGKPFIRAGIFDTGILSDHEDFTLSNGSSVIVNGWDFESEVSIFDSLYAQLPSAEFFHGTACAGILGAIRNNGKGVAGVAGGDSLGGVSMYDMRILSTDSFFVPLGPTMTFGPMDYMLNAIAGSSVDDSFGQYNFGLHVMSNSWRVSDYILNGKANTSENINLLIEATHFVNRAQVTFVAAIGNEGSKADISTYPATIDDDWILTVGGTDNQGQYTNKASRSWLLDVAAPYNPNEIFVYTTSYLGIDQYNSFNGTSAATPHVAGVAALLMSYLNDSSFTLAPEDVEYILQVTAVDADTLLYPGPDSLTGYGKLNAGAALQLVEKPFRKVLHYRSDSIPPVSISETLISSGDTITLAEWYADDIETLYAPGTYVVNTFQIKATFDHSFPTSTSIIGAWPISSISESWALFDTASKLLPRERAFLDLVDNQSAVIVGYFYEVLDSVGNTVGWWPNDTATNQFTLAYGLVIHDSLSTSIGPEDISEFTCEIQPNPTTDNQILTMYADRASRSVDVTVFDLQGRVVMQLEPDPIQPGRNQTSVDLSSFPPGIYFYRIEVEEEVFILKAIKL